MFKVFNHDGNRVISAEELHDKVGKIFIDEEAYEMMREADVDGDGFSTCEAFVKMMMARCTSHDKR